MTVPATMDFERQVAEALLTLQREYSAARTAGLEPPEDGSTLTFGTWLAPRVAAAISNAAHSGHAGARHGDAIADGLTALREGPR